MNRLLPILFLLPIGCGFGLTEGAVRCGVHPNGMEIYVDGTGSKQGPVTGQTQGADGGTVNVYADAVPYMTCEQAMKTVDAAMAIGDTHGFWVDKSHEFLKGMRLEFINEDDLSVIGEPGKWGFTMNSPVAHDMAVVYSHDNKPDYDVPYTDDARGAVAIWSSAVILSHEMIHVLQTDSFLNLSVLNTHTDKHCHWASSVAPKFAQNLGWAQYSSNFLDACEQKSCSGSVCTPEGK